MSFNLKYAFLFLSMLAIEILIAVFATGFLRHFIGDVLVVILIYFFVKIWWQPENNFKLVLGIFIFAVVIEALQLLNLPKAINLNNKIIQIVLGSTFDWLDILAYAIGCFALLRFKLSSKA